MSSFPSFNVTTTSQTDSNDYGTVIANLVPASFDALVKVLNLLQEKDSVHIINSQIIQFVSKGNTYLTTNISELLNNKMFNLEFVNSRISMASLKTVKSNEPITIYEVEDCYRIKTNKFIIRLPKPSKEETELSLPNFENYVQVGNPISIGTGPLLNLIKLNEKDFVTLLISNDQLKAVYVPNENNEIICNFDKFEDCGINNANAEISLKSYSFLLIPSDEYRLTLRRSNDNYILVTDVKTQFGISITIIEMLEQTTYMNLFN
jgi:hypothetical protein